MFYGREGEKANVGRGDEPRPTCQKSGKGSVASGSLRLLTVRGNLKAAFNLTGMMYDSMGGEANGKCEISDFQFPISNLKRGWVCFAVRGGRRLKAEGRREQVGKPGLFCNRVFGEEGRSRRRGRRRHWGGFVLQNGVGGISG
jgi:hypothetical protein